MNLEKLGWKFDTIWNNRAMFCIGDYSIFSHNGDIGIVDPIDESFHLIYCDLTESELSNYTELVKKLVDIDKYPDKYTYSEVLKCKSILKNFIQEMDKRS